MIRQYSVFTTLSRQCTGVGRMGQRRISASDLQLGNALQWDVRDKQGKLLLKAGHVVTSELQLERLIAEGMVNDDPAAAGHHGGSSRPAVQEVLPSVVEMLKSALMRLSQAVMQIHSAPEQFIPRIIEAAELIHKANKTNRDITLAYIVLKHEGRYSIAHSLDAAIITDIVANGLHYSDERRRSCVCAALTMNLSMLELQDQLQKQAEELSDEQRAKVRSHPRESCEMLKSVGVTDQEWLDVVLHHHEQADGTGYPDGLVFEHIAESAKLVQLSDLYCARVSPRAYRASVQSNVALRDIFLERGKAVDPLIAAHFIKEIGIYPPGTVVKLTSGEIGIVSHQAGKSNTPMVHAIIGPRGVPLTTALRRDSSQEQYSIRDVIDARKLGLRVNMVTIWGKEAAGG